jgi:predicted outer membrane repeat protein
MKNRPLALKPRILLPLTLLCAAMASLQIVHATTITVMNTDDSGTGSLRQALADANDGDTINFDVSVTGTINLTSGELLVNASIIIAGPSANTLAVDGNSASRVFEIASGKTVTIAGLTITNGSADHGGGIYNYDATLTVSNCTVSGNTALGFDARGGGIYNTQSGILTVNNSTISGNSADLTGGGIYSGTPGFDATLTVSNCTVSGNSAGTSGGGITNNGGTAGAAYSTISNTTFSDNSAPQGGAIYQTEFQAFAQLTIGNTVLKAGASGANIDAGAGTVISLGYNLSSDDGGGYLTATGDQINTDPKLGPLQNNGGPTFTHLPSNDSPVVDAGDPNTFTDQRGPGFSRVVNNRIDIGAVEVQATPAPAPVAPTALDATNKTASSFTANWSSVSGATGYRLDVSTSSSFASYVAGYENLDVGNVTAQSVTGLAASTFYYYRLRTYNSTGTSPNSNVVTVKTKKN